MTRAIGRRLALATSLVVLVASAGWPQEGRKPDAGASWKARILGVTSPSEVPILRRSPYGGTEPARAQAASEGAQWIVVSVELTAPAVGASLAPAAIELIDHAGAGHAALALTALTDRRAPDYVFFKESENLAAISSDGNLRWMFRQGKLTFQMTTPQRVSVLFAPPSGTKGAAFVAGDSGQVPLTRRK